jgi:hypothetical protein
MNWSKHIWMKEKMTVRSETIKEAFSNITQSWTEFASDGPYSVDLDNMAHANNVSLKIYRTACRHVPSMLNRQTTLYYKDYHMSKRNLGHWFRRAKNMRNLSEISSLQSQSFDMLFDSIYCNAEHSIYNKYLQTSALTREGSNDYLKLQGMNNLDDHRFENKTKFFEKFVKGKKSLY